MEDVAPLVAVRPMKAGDIFRVAGIEREAFGRPGAGAELEKELQLPQSRPCVATVAGAVVGYLIYWQVTDEFQLLDIAVAREFRCRGVAGQMLDYLVVEADTLLDAAIHLEVAARNSSALRLYTSRGFVEVGVRENYYGPGENAFLLSRRAR